MIGEIIPLICRMERELLEGEEAAALQRQLVRLLVRRAQARVAMVGKKPAGGVATGSASASNPSSREGGEILAAAFRDYEDALR